MKKIAIILFGLLFLSTNILAKKPWREGTWALNELDEGNTYFIEMDAFDQQFLTVSVAPQLTNGEPTSAVSLRCSSGVHYINPGEKATCIVNWSYEIATLTFPKGKHNMKATGTYKITYLS